MRIYGFGDSHILGLKPILYPRWVKGATAYGLLREDSRTRARNSAVIYLKGVEDGTWVLLSFGEVDCRCHINKFDNPYEAAENAVKRYYQFIDEISRFKIIIFAPVPNLYYNFTKDELKKMSNRKRGFYTIVGEYSERIMATSMFHYFLRKYKGNRNVHIVDVFDKVLGKDFLYSDFVHLNEQGNQIVMDEVKKICKI